MTSAHERPFPFDSQIPGLPLAMDGSMVGPLLQGHLRVALQQPLVVEDCRIVRIRYRPETRCLVQYAVTVRDLDTGVSSRQLLAGALYGDSQRAARRAELLSGVGFVPELRMVVSAFPSDRRLPQAAILMNAADLALRDAIARSFANSSWRVSTWRTDVVRYREHLSLVVRYTVTAQRENGDACEDVFYAKAYPDGDAARRMFRYLTRLAAHAASSDMGVRIDAPIECFDHLKTVLFASTAGRPLNDILERSSPDEKIAAVQESAHALARFNLSDAPTVRHYSLDDYLESLRRPVTLLTRVCPEIAADLSRIVDVAGRRLSEVPSQPTHRDMKPEHVLLGGGRPALIDLDSCASADPVLDAGLMLARFVGLASDSRVDAKMDPVAQAFEEAYSSRVPAAWRSRLPIYVATSLVEVAAGLFHRQEPDWRQRAAGLVRAATARLSGNPRRL